MDQNSNTQLLPNFCNNNLNLSVVTNSLKFYLEDKENYIWIDPPWILLHKEVLITNSTECPNPAEGNEFKLWAEKLDILRGQKLISFEQNDDSFILFFTDDLKLKLPLDQAENESWYVSFG